VTCRRTCPTGSSASGIDTFVLPPLMFTNPDIVRGLLSLRHTRMQTARANAQMAGLWFECPVVLPQGWDAIYVERGWVRGQPTRLVAEHGAQRARLIGHAPPGGDLPG